MSPPVQNSWNLKPSFSFHLRGTGDCVPGKASVNFNPYWGINTGCRMLGTLLKARLGGRRKERPGAMSLARGPTEAGTRYLRWEAWQSLHYFAWLSFLPCSHFAPPPNCSTVSIFACHNQRIWGNTLTHPPVINTRSKSLTHLPPPLTPAPPQHLQRLHRQLRRP